MALLLNRKQGSRMECLYYILQSCYARFGSNSFRLKDIKYDEDDPDNVHTYCKLLTESMGIRYCPFLLNPLSNTKCYATNSISDDSTKSKYASEAAGSFEALGFFKRLDSRSFQITQEGIAFASADFFSFRWNELARKAVLSYGPLIGFLHKIKELPKTFSHTDIYLSYPKTEEQVGFLGESGTTSFLTLSADSKKDSDIRTKTRLINWCVTAGLLEPAKQSGQRPQPGLPPQLTYREFINQEKMTSRSFLKTRLYEDFLKTKPFVPNPLSYSHLHKAVRALRERGQKDLRQVTLKYKPMILDRRFVFVYLLNEYSRYNEALPFDKLISVMDTYGEVFFTPGNSSQSIMETEAEIADIAGIPFEIGENNALTPLSLINTEVLTEDAPKKSIALANEILEKMRK